MKSCIWGVLRTSTGVLVMMTLAALLATPALAYESEHAFDSPMGTTATTVQVMPSGSVLSDDSESSVFVDDENPTSAGREEGAGAAAYALPESSMRDSGSGERFFAPPLKTGDSLAVFALVASLCTFLGAAGLVEAFRRRHDIKEGKHRRIGSESVL